MPVLATSAAAFIAVVGGSLTYVHQKKTEHKSELLLSRQEIYQSYIEKAHEFISLKENTSSQNELKVVSDELSVITTKMLLIATDEVAHKAGRFRRMLAGFIDSSGDDKIETFSQMILAMRQDCFETSKFTSNEMALLVPLVGNSEREFIKSMEKQKLDKMDD